MLERQHFWGLVRDLLRVGARHLSYVRVELIGDNHRWSQPCRHPPSRLHRAVICLRDCADCLSRLRDCLLRLRRHLPSRLRRAVIRLQDCTVSLSDVETAPCRHLSVQTAPSSAGETAPCRHLPSRLHRAVICLRDLRRVVICLFRLRRRLPLRLHRAVICLFRLRRHPPARLRRHPSARLRRHPPARLRRCLPGRLRCHPAASSTLRRLLRRLRRQRPWTASSTPVACFVDARRCFVDQLIDAVVCFIDGRRLLRGRRRLLRRPLRRPVCFVDRVVNAVACFVDARRLLRRRPSPASSTPVACFVDARRLIHRLLRGRR